MNGAIAVLLLILISQITNACMWSERVEVHVLSANGYPIEGATVKAYYQRNVAGMYDAVETRITGADGAVSFSLCDSAPGYDESTLFYKYNITVVEPFTSKSKLWQDAYDVKRKGLNNLTFVYDFVLSNLTVNVRDGVGNPVNNSVVSVSGAHVSKNKTTNASGTAWFIIPLETVDVRAYFGEFVLYQRVQNLAWDTAITISAPPPIRNNVAVTVRDDEGLPVANLSVLLTTPKAEIHGKTNETGEVVFEEVAFNDVNISIVADNRTIYQRALKLTQNKTALEIVLDLHQPVISDTTIRAFNIGTVDNESYRLFFNVSAHDNITPAADLNVTLYYSVDSRPWVEVRMQNAGEGQFNAIVDLPNANTPFDISYYAKATDAAGNSKEGSRELITINYIPPPPTPTPIPSPTPPRNITSELPEPLKSMLGPVEMVLLSVSDYMWVLIFLVLVILGGTIFVFVSVNAFFYMKKAKKKENEGKVS